MAGPKAWTLARAGALEERDKSLGVDEVIKGWTEGLQLMKVGDSYRFWIPGNLAYGNRPTRPGVPAGMLVFDVELLGIDP